MSIARTLGSATGNAGAFTKHAALASGVHSLNFVDAYLSSTREQYALKDKELSARRDALRAARIAVAAETPPARRRQAKLAA